MAIRKNLPVEDYLGIETPANPQNTATPKGRAADDYLGIGALGGQTNTPASKDRQASDYLGLGALGNTGTGIAVDPASSSAGGTGTGTGGKGTGVRTYQATDGTEFTDQAAYATYQASLNDTAASKLSAQQDAALAAQASQAQRQSAYDLLFEQFKQYGLSDLVEPLKNLITSGASPSEFTIRLRESEPYKKRFAANAQRIAKGLRALDEATYIGMEDQYQEVMRQYGLPETYYAKDATGKQAGFEQLLANDVSNVELADRLMVGQERVLNANPEILNTLKKFYGDTITNGDILAYVLDPNKAIKDIQRKVTAAEIGAAQVGAGLQATKAGAEQLAAEDITKERYQAAAPTIAEASIRGGQLASIYGEDPYTQQTAEQAVLNTPGSAAAIRQTKKLTALEEASFSGRSGRGVLARERSGSI
jgi:hypothetical protein